MKPKINKKRSALMCRILRETMWFSQGEISEKMGMTQQGYSSIERSECVPKIETVVHFCAALKIKPLIFFEYFLDEDKYPRFTHVLAEQIFISSKVLLETPDTTDRAQLLMVMIRTIREMKQSDIAEKMNMTQQRYCYLEKSHGPILHKDTVKFCELANVNVDAFIQLANNKKEVLSWKQVYAFLGVST